MRTPCTEHSQRGDRDGYGRLSFDGKARPAHRVMFCRANQLPYSALDGVVVRHRCDNPRCINPEHMELGSQRDNINDAVERGRTWGHVV